MKNIIQKVIFKGIEYYCIILNNNEFLLCNETNHYVYRVHKNTQLGDTYIGVLKPVKKTYINKMLTVEESLEELENLINSDDSGQ